MKSAVKKSGLILCGLLLTIAAAGHFFSGGGSQANVSVVTERVLVPGGQSVGVRMDVRGVLVVGLEEIVSADGEKINPGLLSGLQIGDRILSINGTEVYSADEVQTLVNKIQSTVKLKVKRNRQKLLVTVKPVKAKSDGLYKLGIWVKDKTAGIGTLTYYDPANNTFGALGHGIVDVESNSILPVESGQLLQSQVQEVKEGRDGSPGEIRGIFYHTSDPLGTLQKNCNFGVFGTAAKAISNPLYSDPIPVGSQDQVEKGKAYILSTLGDNKIEKFEIEIEKIERQRKPDDKGMVIKVTDPALIKESGGIVQGMSGSPIIQNGRIVGAVTHVFVNDAKRGYAIFIEWMLEESAKLE